MRACRLAYPELCVCFRIIQAFCDWSRIREGILVGIRGVSPHFGRCRGCFGVFWGEVRHRAAAGDLLRRAPRRLRERVRPAPLQELLRLELLDLGKEGERVADQDILEDTEKYLRPTYTH